MAMIAITTRQFDQGETMPVSFGSRLATWIAFDVS